MKLRRSPACLGVMLVLACTAAAASESIKLVGYLAFKKGTLLIVDAQRVTVTPKTKLRISGGATTVAAIPVGYEVTVKGERAADGTVVAKSLDAQANGMAFMEKDVLASTTQAEQAYVKAAKVYDTGPDGKEHSMGKLIDKGPEVDRCRTIVDRLLPSYVDKKKVRVYVVENPEWNAMAMANFSIYTFSGLMKDMDDDELAIVLGHEIAHATHEHSRRQAKKGMIGSFAGTAANIGAAFIGNDMARGVAQQATAVGVGTFSNYYSRDYED